MTNEVNGEKQFPCGACEHVSKTRTGLSQHERVSHGIYKRPRPTPLLTGDRGVIGESQGVPGTGRDGSAVRVVEVTSALKMPEVFDAVASALRDVVAAPYKARR